MLLIQKLKIDIDDVKKRNKELIATNWLSALNAKQKKFINWRKGVNPIMNRDGLFGYAELSTYLLNPEKFNEINVDDLKEYFSLYDIKTQWSVIPFANINNDIKSILKKIHDGRISKIQKYIKLEDSIFKHGLRSNDTIYRMQNEKVNDNVFKNSTSWSLAPQEFFCWGSTCHLYITTLTKKIKVLYLENNLKDKNLDKFADFEYYEFEYILPRDLEFEEYKTKKKKILNHAYSSKED